MNKFKTGLFISRMQPIHKGHQLVIDEGIKMCDKLLVLIGSSQEYGTKRNPFPSTLRHVLLKNIYQDKIIIAELPDYTSEDDLCVEWGEYLLNHAKHYLGELPEVLFTGNKDISNIAQWFSERDLRTLKIHSVDVSRIPISATVLREAIFNDNREVWNEYLDERLHDYYYILKSFLSKN